MNDMERINWIVESHEKQLSELKDKYVKLSDKLYEIEKKTGTIEQQLVHLTQTIAKMDNSIDMIKDKFLTLDNKIDDSIKNLQKQLFTLVLSLSGFIGFLTLLLKLFKVI